MRKNNEKEEDHKSIKIRPWSAQEPKKWVRVSNRGVASSAGGSLFEEKRDWKIEQTDRWSHTPMGRRPGEFFVYVVGH